MRGPLLNPYVLPGTMLTAVASTLDCKGTKHHLSEEQACHSCTWHASLQSLPSSPALQLLTRSISPSPNCLSLDSKCNSSSKISDIYSSSSVQESFQCKGHLPWYWQLRKTITKQRVKLQSCESVQFPRLRGWISFIFKNVSSDES